jgi:hypothetical protein
LLKRSGKEAVDGGGAPATGDGQTSEVPETKTMGLGREPPAGGGATMSVDDVEPAAATEEDAPRPPGNAKDVFTAEEDAPQPMEATVDAEVPQV